MWTMGWNAKASYPKRKNVMVSGQKKMGSEVKEETWESIVNLSICTTVHQMSFFELSTKKPRDQTGVLQKWKMCPDPDIRMVCYWSVPLGKICHSRQWVHALEKCFHLHPLHWS